MKTVLMNSRPTGPEKKPPPQDMLDFINAKNITCPQCGGLDWDLAQSL